MKYFKYFLLLILISFIVVLPGCKTGGGDDNSNTPKTPKTFTLTPNVKDVFSKEEKTGGRVIVNGVEGQSGEAFRVDGNKVNTIEVEVSGYNSSYIFGVLDGTVVFARDKNGTFQTYWLTKNTTIDLYLVPSDFDTVKLAKSIGELLGPDDDKDFIGDGTVIRYDKSDIDVALWEIETGAGDAEKNLIDAITKINNAVKNVNNNISPIIKLNYIGKVNSYLTNGVTHEIFKNQNPVHSETFDNNIISRSFIKTNPIATSNVILGELIQAANGLRADGGTGHVVYLTSSGLSSDAGKAMYLVAFSPPGFQYSTTDLNPAASQPLEILSSVQQQRDEEIRRKEYQNSLYSSGGTPVSGPVYDGPGRTGAIKNTKRTDVKGANKK